MPLIDVRCVAETCGHVFEHVRPVAEWPATPPCQRCQSPTEQVHLPKATRWSVDPVVVFRAPDGTMRFPGEADGVSARRYAAAGFERVEIRSATEMRRFETRMNRDEQARAEQVFETRERRREASESTRRATLREEMTRMSPLGRDLARAAIARSNAIRRSAPSVGFHSEVYSHDRSNREASRDDRGRRRRD